MEPETRKPTVDEAAYMLAITRTAEYRYNAIEHWRKLYGDEFVQQAEQLAEKMRGKR